MDKLVNEYFIDIENKKTRIVEWGDKSKKTIFCIHGLGSTALSFIEIGEILRNKYHIISLDLPGFGKSSPFINYEDYHIPNLVNWIDKIVSKLGFKEFYLLSHSWGAQIALFFLRSYPEKVIKMLMLDGGYHIHKIYHEYNNKNNLPLSNEQEEIEFYIDDFDNYIFPTLGKFMESERSAYSK